MGENFHGYSLTHKIRKNLGYTVYSHAASVVMQIVSTGPGDIATIPSRIMPYTASIAVDQNRYKSQQGFISVVKPFMLMVKIS